MKLGAQHRDRQGMVAPRNAPLVEQNMSTVADTIDLLRRVILDHNCDRMNLSTVKGYLGELLVKEKLEAEQVNVTHLGNQSGHDLEFDVNGRSISIDVKFSVPKCEYDKYSRNWGWALLHGNKRRKVSCTHMVCVAADDVLGIVEFYVIPRRHVRRFPKGIGRFGRVRKGFFLFESEPAPEPKKAWMASQRTCRRLVQNGVAVRVGRDDSLLDVLVRTLEETLA